MRAIKLLSVLARTASALSSAGWRSQSIYQVITDRFAKTDGSTTGSCTAAEMGNYCGGTFQGIVNKLDYIQGMGFTAIWISPVVAQVSTMTPYGLPYHGYWPQDLYSINPKFGTAGDLKALSAALHRRGMYLMVDVVPNHSAYNGAPGEVQYSKFHPFNDPKYFHTPYCAIDYTNKTSLEDCWMGDATVSLPDLRVEDPAVQSMLNTWVKQFVSNYSVDGLRIDSVMQMSKSFFPGFVSAAGVYTVGEVMNGGPTYLCDYQNYMSGVLNYAYYYWIVRAFSTTSSTMTELASNIPWLTSVCKDTTLLGNFMENHDQPRFASMTTDSSLIQNAIAFTLLSDGIPIIYYGQEQGFSGAADPANREALWTSGYKTDTPIYKLLGRLNLIRNTAITNDATYASKPGSVIHSDRNTLVTLKGGIVSVFTNDGAGGPKRSISLPSVKTGYTPGTQYVDVISCRAIATDSAGTLVVPVTQGLPMAIYGATAISGSGICASVSEAKVIAISHASSVSTSRSVFVSASTSPSPLPPSSTSTSTSSLPTTPQQKPCTPSTTMTFTTNITTSWGQSAYLLGSTPSLGNWNTSNAIPLNGSPYPIWSTNVTMAAGTYVEYKFVKAADPRRGVLWESGGNRNLTVPGSSRGCGAGWMGVEGVWRD